MRLDGEGWWVILPGLWAGVEKHEEDPHAGDACCELAENGSHIALSPESLQKEESKDGENKQIREVENYENSEYKLCPSVNLRVKFECPQVDLSKVLIMWLGMHNTSTSTNILFSSCWYNTNILVKL